MIILLGVWVIVFLIIFLLGLAVNVLVLKHETACQTKNVEVFFIGFLTLTVIAAYFSIFLPLNYYALSFTFIIGLLVLFFLRSSIIIRYGALITTVKKLHRSEWLILVFLLLFIAINSTYGIQHWDSGLYHAQSIKWIREYAVVPGLGNLHLRLAFNSLLFPISSIFTIDTTGFSNTSLSILIYPINAVVLIVFMFHEYFFIRNSFFKKNWFNVSFGITVVFLIILLTAKWASSPAPDVLNALLIIYAFQMLIEYGPSLKKEKLVLLASVIFICITVKLSSALLVLLLIPFLFKKKALNSLLCFSLLGLVIMLPFLVRNHFAAGYLLFPFSGIDLFSVDWKIAKEQMRVLNRFIEAFGRIPRMDVDDVMNMSFSDWSVLWFKKKSFIIQSILVCNVLSVFVMIYHLFKKHYFHFFLQLTVIINLLLWFYKSPDPRFVFGFLIVGFAFFISALIRLMHNINIVKKVDGKSSFLVILSLILLLALGVQRQRVFRSAVKNPSIIFAPRGFGVVKTIRHETNFVYYFPASGARCFNSQLPCSTQPKNNVEMRTGNIQGGFKNTQPEQFENLTPGREY